MSPLLLRHSPSQSQLKGQFFHLKKQSLKATNVMQAQHSVPPLRTERHKDSEDFTYYYKKQTNFKLSKVIDTYNRQKENIQKQIINKEATPIKSQKQEQPRMNVGPPNSPPLLNSFESRKKSLPPIPLVKLQKGSRKNTIDYDLQNEKSDNNVYNNNDDQAGDPDEAQGFDFSFSQLNQCSNDGSFVREDQLRFKHKNRRYKNSDPHLRTSLPNNSAAVCNNQTKQGAPSSRNIAIIQRPVPHNSSANISSFQLQLETQASPMIQMTTTSNLRKQRASIGSNAENVDIEPQHNNSRSEQELRQKHLNEERLLEGKQNFEHKALGSQERGYAKRQVSNSHHFQSQMNVDIWRESENATNLKTADFKRYLGPSGFEKMQQSPAQELLQSSTQCSSPITKVRRQAPIPTLVLPANDSVHQDSLSNQQARALTAKDKEQSHFVLVRGKRPQVHFPALEDRSLSPMRELSSRTRSECSMVSYEQTSFQIKKALSKMSQESVFRMNVASSLLS